MLVFLFLSQLTNFRYSTVGFSLCFFFAVFGSRSWLFFFFCMRSRGILHWVDPPGDTIQHYTAITYVNCHPAIVQNHCAVLHSACYSITVRSCVTVVHSHLTVLGYKYCTVNYKSTVQHCGQVVKSHCTALFITVHSASQLFQQYCLTQLYSTVPSLWWMVAISWIVSGRWRWL